MTVSEDTLAVSQVSLNALCNAHVTYFVMPLYIKNAFGASGMNKTLRLYAVFLQKNHAKLS